MEAKVNLALYLAQHCINTRITFALLFEYDNAKAMDRTFVSETELSAERHAELEAAKALLALHYASAPVNNTATCAQTNNRLLLFPYLSPTATSTATSEDLDSEEQEMSEAANILVAMANSPCQLTAPSENLQHKERPQVVEEPAKDDSEATISVSSRSSEDPLSHLDRPAMRPRPNKTTINKHTTVQPPAVYDHDRLGPQAKKDGTVDKPIFIGDSSDSSDSDIEHASDAARAQVHARAVKTLSYPQITQQDNRHSSQHKHQKEVLSGKQQQETLSSRQGKPVASPTLRKDGAASSPWIAKLYDAFLDDVVFRNLGYNVKSHRAGEHARKAFVSTLSPARDSGDESVKEQRLIDIRQASKIPLESVLQMTPPWTFRKTTPSPTLRSVLIVSFKPYISTIARASAISNNLQRHRMEFPITVKSEKPP
jgi:hypothetical protein